MFRRSRSALIVTCLALGSAGGYLINSTLGPVHAEQQKVSPVVAKELTSYRTIVKDVVPAVVSIDSKVKARRGMRFRGDRDGNIELGLGSGVIVDPKGTILTNYHVVDGSDFVEVHLADGRTFTSHDIAADRKTDLAIVKIQADKPLPFLQLGDSNQMEVGDRVLAVGAPFGLASSVTHGIISAKARNMGLNAYEDFLQTDAAINPGNSGGPLISLDGQVIGINSAIKSRSGGFQGVGMAISSNLAKSVMTQLMKDGAVHRGYLGVAVGDVNQEVAQELHVKEHAGVVITRVFPKSPAAKGGLKPGDVVTTIAGKPVREGAELQKVILSLPLNQPVEVAFLRDGETKSAKVTVEEQPEEYGLRTARDDDDE